MDERNKGRADYPGTVRIQWLFTWVGMTGVGYKVLQKPIISLSPFALNHRRAFSDSDTNFEPTAKSSLNDLALPNAQLRA